jgi:hypothetical protein
VCRQVDSQILNILRQRRMECMQWEGPDYKFKCKKIADDYEEAAVNWFIKCKHMLILTACIDHEDVQLVLRLFSMSINVIACS